MILCLVTDRRRLAGDVPFEAARRCCRSQAEYAVAAGVDWIQVRERDLPASELAALVNDVVQIARGSPTRVLVNDRADVALASGADGVHLRADSIAATRVRSLLPPGSLVGQSVHRAAEAAACQSVDYLIAGTIFPTVSKPSNHATTGIDGLARIVRASSVPVLAIGGIGVHAVRRIAETGAAGVAAIGLFLDESARGCGAVPLASIVAAARAAFDTASVRS